MSSRRSPGTEPDRQRPAASPASAPASAPAPARIPRISALVVLLLAGLFLPHPLAAAPYISEFLASNASVLADTDRNYVDWIELHNPDAATVDLEGWYLTDSAIELTKWRFPALLLGPDAYAVVFASGKNRTNAGAPLHTSFKLGAAGEYLALVAPDGRTVVSEFSPVFPPQTTDVAYGAGTVFGRPGTGYLSPPTPGAPNGIPAPGIALAPEITPAGGIFTNSVVVTLSAGTANAEIRYTLDGSVPTTDSARYEGPITLTGTRQLRARTFAGDLLPSPVAGTAFTRLGLDLRNFSSDLPLVVVNLFNRAPADGVRVPAYFEVRSTSTNDARARFSAPAVNRFRGGIEIRGSSSTQFPKKSYGVEIQDEAGLDLRQPLLDLPGDSDWVLYAPFTDKSLIRDALAYELSNRIGRYAPRTRFVELFLNSGVTDLVMADYQGVYVLVEKVKVSPDRVALTGMEPEDLQEPAISGGYVLKRDRFDANDQVITTTHGVEISIEDPKRSQTGFTQRNWIRTWLNQMETALYGTNWRNPANGYARHLDAESFIDHHWLVETAKNIDGYRLSTFWHKDRSDRLRMGPIWDYNLTFGNADYLEGWQTNGWYYPFVGDPGHTWFNRLLTDPDYLQRRIDRWAELRDGPFATSNVVTLINTLASRVREAQSRNFSKWPILGTYVWPNWHIASTWSEEISWMTGWTTNRLNWIDRQFVRRPSGSHPGGYIPNGATVALQAPVGVLYYTLNGSDPRALGGAVAGAAVRYAAPLDLQTNAQLFARARSGTNWSAPLRTTFITRPPALAFTEVMYQPAGDHDELGFVELRNVGDTIEPLAGVTLSGVVSYTFPSDAGSLWPGEHVVIARDLAAFRVRYGGDLRAVGDFRDALPHAGGGLRLTGSVGEPILAFTYDARWYRTTAGGGFSLTVVNDTAPVEDWSTAGNWKPSLLAGGTPGRANVLDRGSPTLLGARAAADGLHLRYLATAGVAHAVQATPTLATPAWSTVLRFVPRSNGPEEVTDPAPPDAAARFYRLVTPAP